MNRGSLRAADGREDERKASMRPRFMNRGSGARRTKPRCATSGFNEAPIHESGKQQPCGRHALDDRASMRPRFMNRGSPPPEVCSRACKTRFNEAPIHESGKHDRRRRKELNHDRFNEAPIHESGKPSSSSSIPDTCMSCFNEAPIHESGKHSSESQGALR